MAQRRLKGLWEQLVRFGQRAKTPLSEGNAARLIDDGAEWMEAMKRAICSARQRVDFEIYIWADDGTGRRMLEAMKAALERGARVRGVVDAVGSWGARDLLEEAREAGVEIRLHHPLHWRLPWRSWHRRNHRKLLIADGEALVGSANWSEDYDGRLRSDCNRDLGLALRGPVVLDLQTDFERAWRHAGGRKPMPLVPSPTKDHEDFWHEGVSIQVVSSFSSGIRAIRRHLRVAMGQLRQSLIIANPYFVPDPQLKRLLMRIARRGVQVDLLLPGHTDHALVQAASRHMYPALLRSGIRIWERSERLLHAKAAVLDGRLAVLGSANLDMRSFRYNQELNLVLNHASLAQELERVLIRDLAFSHRMDEVAVAAQTWLQRLFQRLAHLFWPWL